MRGEPTMTSSKKTTVRFFPGEHRAVERLARRWGQSRSGLIRRAVASYVAGLDLSRATPDDLDALIIREATTQGKRAAE
jgi:hypothetical protein